MNYSLEVEALDRPERGDDLRGRGRATRATAIYTFFAGPAEKADYSGVLAQGTIDEANFTGSLEGGTVGDLIALIKDGKAYVSVGTTANPVDAIRGQISETTTSTTGETRAVRTAPARARRRPLPGSAASRVAWGERSRRDKCAPLERRAVGRDGE